MKVKLEVWWMFLWRVVVTAAAAAAVVLVVVGTRASRYLSWRITRATFHMHKVGRDQPRRWKIEACFGSVKSCERRLNGSNRFVTWSELRNKQP